MTIQKLICLTSLMIAVATLGASAQSSPTNINPALTYYQSFLLSPTLEPADHEYLLVTNHWRNQTLPKRFGDLVATYNSQFGFVRAAACSGAPCDWGIDLSKGPATLLPHLARGKAVAIAARVRALWDLQEGQSVDAAEDLVASLVLGRNLSRDGTLISMLVQIAVQAISCHTVAENFGRFSPEALQRLVEGFDAAPAPGTVADARAVEKASYYDWSVRRIQELRQEHAGNETKVMEGINEFMGFTLPDLGLTNRWERICRAAGGTSDGVIRLLEEQAAFHDRLAVFLALPYADYQAQLPAVQQEMAQSPNPFINDDFLGLFRARAKEFRAQVTLAMVRSAVEYKLRGQPAFETVKDPCGQGPFGFERFVFNGVDRGFKLKSPFDAGGFQQVMIFVEKEGPPFLVDGPRAGQAKQ